MIPDPNTTHKTSVKAVTRSLIRILYRRFTNPLLKLSIPDSNQICSLFVKPIRETINNNAIPVGCVLSATVAVCFGGVCPRGCVCRGMSAWVVSAWGGGGCLGECLPRGVCWGCLPGRVSYRGCLPEGCLPRWCLPQGRVSARWRMSAQVVSTWGVSA